MNDLNSEHVKLLKGIISKFPYLPNLAKKLNESVVGWGIAAGAAYSIYTNNEDLDDVDIWIKNENHDQIIQILGKDWIIHKSERHHAENIDFEGIDLFTNCVKTKDGHQILNYQWTSSVEDHLGRVTIDNLEYKIVSPEDVVILKVANPRSEQEINQINTFFTQDLIDRDYLQSRLMECNATSEVYSQLSLIK